MRLRYLKDSVDTDILDEATGLSYTLAVQQMENEIADYQYRLYNYPVNQMFGTHSQIPSFLINMHRVTVKSDAEAYISRLNGVAKVIAQAITGLKERETAGIMPPKFVFPKVLESSQNILIGQPFDTDEKESTLLADFTKKVMVLDISDEEKNLLISDAKTALIKSVKPGYESLIAFLSDQELSLIHI